MLLIPKNVGELAKLTSDDLGKLAMAGVLVVDEGGGKYRAVATDGKYMGMVEGEGENPDCYPPLPALTAAPNGATEALVPAGTFAEAFKMVPKAKCKPALEHLAVVLAPNETTMAATDLDKARSVMTRNVEGRFPAYGEAFKSLEKKPALATVTLSAKRLRELLAVAEKFSDPDLGGDKVVLTVRGKDDAVVVEAKGKAQKFTGLLVPLS